MKSTLLTNNHPHNTSDSVVDNLMYFLQKCSLCHSDNMNIFIRIGNGHSTAFRFLNIFINPKIKFKIYALTIQYVQIQNHLVEKLFNGGDYLNYKYMFSRYASEIKPKTRRAFWYSGSIFEAAKSTLTPRIQQLTFLSFLQKV